MDDDAKVLMLFDGVCNFCNDAVLFIIDRDPRQRIQFASLQSELGARIKREHGVGAELSTMALLAHGRLYTRSDAALGVARYMRFPWPLLVVFKLVPRFLRDGPYSWFAARRYRWFGQSESCRVPTPELRQRFLS